MPVLFDFWFCRNPILSGDSVIFLGNYESDPLSPPKGEEAQGERPLDPLLAEFSLTFCGPIPVWGMPERRGRRHQMP
jgi:hypothetical protein